MPTYNGRCDSCGEFEDIMKASEYLKQDGLYCPICRKKATTLIRKAPAIVGPLPSKTLHLAQIGQTFSSPVKMILSGSITTIRFAIKQIRLPRVKGLEITRIAKITLGK